MRRLTVASLVAFSLLIPQAQAQDAGARDSLPSEPAFVARFRFTPLVAPRHPALAPGGRLGARVPPAQLAGEWARGLLASFARRRLLAPPDTAPAVAALPPGAPAPAPAVVPVAPAGVGGFLGQYADLGMQLVLRFELKADQFRNLNCTSTERLLALSGCEGGFPIISPNPQYSVRTAGLVGQRLHVNVDFDSEREFDANNNLQVWYEGLEDEILRRVEAGNVTFRAPASRFIGGAIPANNFGVQAVGQLGPVEFRGIYAQQKGNVVKDRFYTIGAATSQPLDREARDLDFEVGRFFFAVDPRDLPGSPTVDVLAIDAAALPGPLRVGNLRVYRVRALAATSTSNQNIGGVRALACGAGAGAYGVECGVQRVGPFQWEILLEGRDYYVDPSGAWFALANRLDERDYLAVSYVTVTGTDSVGTFPVVANPDTTVVERLRLVYDPRTGVTADAPTFRFELRNAYRIGGSEVLRETVELSLLVNRRERFADSAQTYLARLGLALENDANRFDQYNRLFPRERDPQQGAPLRDYYVVFPHLTPFADSTRLDAAERNDSLYRTPRPLLATQGPPSVFTLRQHGSVSASADRSILSLNSFQIREGSERLYLGTRLLVRDVDYTIDYAVGQVQFRNADSLFQVAGAGGAIVRAQFEERAVFAVAPTSIYGLAATYDLGRRGEVNFTGLFRQEHSAFTRPPLGFEPSSSFIGGVNTSLRFEPAWLTRVVDALPGVRTDAPSALAVSAEVAVSKPEPNRFGQAYLEEFEGEAGRFLSLAEQSWHWGSMPCGDPGAGCSDGQRGATTFGIAATGFDTADAAALTWQSLPYNRTGPVQFLPQQIDPTIRVAGQAQSAEPILWLMLKPDTVVGLADARGAPNWVRPARNAPRWRSIAQSLSPTGIDLSRVEFLEFWVWEDNRRTAKANRAGLLFDFGSVFEDAVAFVPDSFTVTGSDTAYGGVRLAGRGRLDGERDPRTRSWSAALNDEGILTDRVVDGIRNATTGQTLDTLPLCSLTENGEFVAYFFGDLRSRCGRRNGAVDAEDLDGDFLLDSLAGVRTQEDFVRYVFPIGDERYYVRDGGMIPAPDTAGGGASGWRLYRIPFRSDTIQVGRPSLRQVQALRITVVVDQAVPGEADPQIFFGIARLRLVGSSWLKRAETPIQGIAGDRGTGAGEVIASVVSTENRDLGYTPPPGVFDEAGRRDANFQIGTTQINERSLRLLARGLRAGERAEAYLRFTTEGDKNFLRYRKLRVWARGRGPGWEDGDLEFYIKAGKDPNNFYLYHVPARTSSWEPEVVVDFGRWLALRAAIEQAWLDSTRALPACPDSVLGPAPGSFLACDGPYVAHVRDPGSAPPNLASVQELAVGMLRVQEGVFVEPAELWVDDIRLSDVVEDAGVAAAVDVALTAANVADLTVSVSRRDGQFRQLGEDPSFVSDAVASVAGTVRLERFLPAAWGLTAPFTVRYARSASDPFYVSRTDVRADGLDGLRTPRSAATSYGLSLRRSQRSAGPLGRWLLDAVALSGSYATGTARSELSQSASSSYAFNLDYALLPAAKTVSLAGLKLRLNPSAIRFTSSFAASDGERSTFRVPVARASDSLVAVARSESKVWRNGANLELVPATGVQLRVDLASQRDLRDYGDSTTMGRLIRRERRTLLGRDVGLETQRTLSTVVNVTPRLGTWLRPRLALSSRFTLARDPNARQPVRETGDTAGAFRLPAAFSNQRRMDVGAQLDFRRIGPELLGDTTGIARLLGRLTPVDLSYSRARSSTFHRSAFTPSFGYQLGLGGFDAFRSQGGVPGGSAAEHVALGASGGVTLPLGVRFTTSYQETDVVTWILRNAAQVPVRSESVDWPVLTGGWSFTPPPATIGRVLAGVNAQLTYRQRRSESRQPSPIAGGAGGTLTRTVDRTLTPSVTLTWARGILTSFDASAVETEQLNAGNLFRIERGHRNAILSFSFRPPARLARLPSDVRVNARYSETNNRTCLRSAGQTACVPYVDSRLSQYQFTVDTDIPPNMSAGLQMAYILNEERQTNRKVAQLVITAFVNLTTTVGRLP